MMSRQARMIGLVALLHTLVLAVMVGLYAWTSITGEAVVIRTRYVSPQTLAASEKPKLDLEIGRISLADAGGDDDFSLFDSAFVVLRPGSGFWYADAIHEDFPAVQGEAKIIRGRITKLEAGRRPPGGAGEPLPIVTVEFGVEALDLPDDTAAWMSAIPSKRQMHVKVLIDDYGRALRQGVEMNGRPVVTDTLF